VMNRFLDPFYAGLSDLLNISIKETNTQAAKPEFGNAQFNFR
jgi:hypothetical protein